MGWLARKLSGSRFKWRQVRQRDGFFDQVIAAADWLLSPAPYSRPEFLQIPPQAIETNASIQTSEKRAYRTTYASIILPVYNEQACIHQTFDSVLEYARTHPSYDFIFVSDGSTDRTVSLLESRIAVSGCDRIYVLAYPQQGGKGYAVRRGVELAEGDFVCFIDGDLAYSLDHLDLLLAKLERYEVAIGCRSLVPDGNQGLKPIRKIAGKIYNMLSRRLLNLPYVDMQAGLKGFQRTAAIRLFSLQELTGFSFDVELIYLAKKFGYSIAEVPARVSSGHSRKLSKVNLLGDSLRMLRDLLRIRFNDFIGRYE
ncbi:glycosyl transferase [Leptolyngbyaceae cyanobacterium JSC-12]|nr:glycosyl transferase [Leptolyngbyaceae cyanobacterium JSC-12]